MGLALGPRTMLGWTLLGVAAGLSIGCVRFAVLAVYWPHGRGLLWYFVFGFLDTVVVAGVTGAVIGALTHRSRPRP
jgi:hypothetical protein